MKDRKRNGSFYTPKVLADFLVDYISKKFDVGATFNILEPSAGDGIFVKTIISHHYFKNKIKKLVAVEKNKSELEKISSIKHKNLIAINSDFLAFQNNVYEKFSLVIGNPPYIRKKLLTDDQIHLCKSIHDQANLADVRPQNIWTSFLVSCIRLTNENGILALVLPSELLQVKFANELRKLILNEFDRVEIFTFNEILFKDCKGQDTIILIGERKSSQKGIYYCTNNTLLNLVNKRVIFSSNFKINESKWTYYHLDNEEINLIEKLKVQIKKINDYCYSKPGIVTAANDYFIVDEKTVMTYSLSNFVKPIIRKGSLLNGSVVFEKTDFNFLAQNSVPVYLIAINENSKLRSNAKFWKYKLMGEDQNIHKRYKTSIRQEWYMIPNIGTTPEAFFFKRCHKYPKLIKNSAQVLATDSAYIVTMKPDFLIEDLIFSFYNSLTLIFAELDGRHYGGGVLELTPNEFKGLPVPYYHLKENQFNRFVTDFEEKKSIAQICKQNDTSILKSFDKEISDENIQKLFSIREKLFLRRIKSI